MHEDPAPVVQIAKDRAFPQLLGKRIFVWRPRTLAVGVPSGSEGGWVSTVLARTVVQYIDFPVMVAISFSGPEIFIFSGIGRHSAQCDRDVSWLDSVWRCVSFWIIIVLMSRRVVCECSWLKLITFPLEVCLQGGIAPFGTPHGRVLKGALILGEEHVVLEREVGIPIIHCRGAILVYFWKVFGRAGWHDP